MLRKNFWAKSENDTGLVIRRRRFRPIALAFAWGALVVFINTATRGAEFEQALKQFNTGQYEDCLKSTRQAIKEGAAGQPWRLLMIKSLGRLGRYDEAAKDVGPVLVNYSNSVRAMMLGYEVYQRSGQSDLAQKSLTRTNQLGRFFDIDFWDAPELVALGEAELLMGAEPRMVLEGFFDRAKKKDPDCREAYLATGQLALDKHDYELAAKQYQQALKRFGDDADLQFGLAKAFLPSDRKRMLRHLSAALQINKNHVPALLLRAEHQIDSEDYAKANKTLEQIIAVNASHSDAWAFRAVLAHLRADAAAIKRTRDQAFKHWKNNPAVDYLIGRKLSQKYRFREAAAYQRQALKFDSNYLPAKIQLAQDLLRLGEEDEGWKLSKQVLDQDEYNVVAYNLEKLHETLSKFETLRTDGFILRMEKQEAAIYGARALKLLESAKAVLCEKYGLKIKRPVVVEIFPDQQDFAIRTFGVPGGIGYLGVCFGNVITANSPGSVASGSSNWEAMLWHEFCHVVTLHLTHNKMPRWLSEGISVYEESQQDPRWGLRMNPQFRQMILSGQLTPVGKLTGAFLNPSSAVHLQFAYYESSLVVEFLIQHYGLKSVKDILADLGRGVPIDRAIETRAAPLATLEKEFETFARKRAAALAPGIEWQGPLPGQLDPTDSEALASWVKKHPNNFWGLTRLGRTLTSERKWQQAKAPLKKLIGLYPQHTSAYELLAKVHRNLKESKQERQVLSKFASISSSATGAYLRLMELASEQKDWQEVTRNAQRYLAVDPLLATPYVHLARASEASERSSIAIDAYQRLLLLDPADPADVHFRLARLLLSTDRAAARRHVLEALADAPRFRDAHRLLLKIVGETKKTNSKKPAPEIKSTDKISPKKQKSASPSKRKRL